MTKILIFLLPLFGLSQTLDSIFLKQPLEIRGCLTLNDYDLKGKVKKITTANYTFDAETGKKNSRANIEVKHFNKNGLIVLIENYDSENNRDKFISKFHYSSKRLHSVSGYWSSKYKYDENGRLISILTYRDEIEKDTSSYKTFEYNLKNFIVLERNVLDSTNIEYEYNSNNEININKFTYDNIPDGNQSFEYSYDFICKCSITVQKNYDGTIMSKFITKIADNKHIKEFLTVDLETNQEILESKRIYKFDKNMNWIFEEIYDLNNKLIQTNQQILDYY